MQSGNIIGKRKTRERGFIALCDLIIARRESVFERLYLTSQALRVELLHIMIGDVVARIISHGHDNELIAARFNDVAVNRVNGLPLVRESRRLFFNRDDADVVVALFICCQHTLLREEAGNKCPALNVAVFKFFIHILSDFSI